MTRLAIVAAALACSACSAAPNNQSSANQTAPAPRQVLPPGTKVGLRFNPPIDQPIRYRVAQGAAIQRGAYLTMVVQFRRTATGYQMSSTFELPPEAASNPAAVFMARPIVYDVDRNGKITGIADEEKWLTDGEAFVMPRLRPDEAEGLRRYIRNYRTLPLQQRIAVFSRTQAPILSFATFEGEVGASRTEEDRGRSKSGSARRTVSATLRSVEDGRATIIILQQIPAEQMQAMARQALEAQGRTEQARALPAIGAGTIGTAAVVDISTGLTERYEARIVQGAENERGGNGPLMIIERIRD